METTNNLAQELLNFIMGDEHSIDVDGASSELTQEVSKTSPDNARPLTCVSFEVMSSGNIGNTRKGVGYRRRWKITVEMLEDTRETDE